MITQQFHLQGPLLENTSLTVIKIQQDKPILEIERHAVSILPFSRKSLIKGHSQVQQTLQFSCTKADIYFLPLATD